MEQLSDAMELLDLMAQPAFCVRDGTVVKVNPAAAPYLIEPGTKIEPLLETGSEEYAAFTGGRLYLTLSLAGLSLGVSVTKAAGLDIFCLEEEADSGELRAMALAARELREPLASVMLTAGRLFPVSGRDEDPRTREQVARINRGLFQMLRIIGNMSDAGSSTASSPLEMRDACAVLDEIFDKACALVEHTGVRLVYEGHPESVYTLIDSERLERAVYNILSNALKFTPKGGTIAAKLTRRGKKLCLTIRDSGSGIRPELLGAAGTRYTRQPGLEDGRFGIGLGMVLIRSTAARHGGVVLLDQPEGGGTRVTMTIAIRQQSSSQVRSPFRVPDYTGERDHGLIELSEVLPYDLYEHI